MRQDDESVAANCSNFCNFEKSGNCAFHCAWVFILKRLHSEWVPKAHPRNGTVVGGTWLAGRSPSILPCRQPLGVEQPGQRVEALHAIDFCSTFAMGFDCAMIADLFRWKFINCTQFVKRATLLQLYHIVDLTLKIQPQCLTQTQNKINSQLGC